MRARLGSTVCVYVDSLWGFQEQLHVLDLCQVHSYELRVFILASGEPYGA